MILLLLLAGQFHFARLHYEIRTPGSMYPWYDGLKFWATDYHDGTQEEGSKPMDDSLTEILKRTTSIDVGAPIQPRITDDIFASPLLYVVEAEQVSLTPAEARRLREYIDRGGMIWMDDFHGEDEWTHVMREIRKILPSAKAQPLTLDHEIFHLFYNIREILQACLVYLGEHCTEDPATCDTKESPDDFPDIEGIYHEGRLVFVLTHGFDIGDGIEWLLDSKYPVRFSKFAIEFSTNVILYALSH